MQVNVQKIRAIYDGRIAEFLFGADIWQIDKAGREVLAAVTRT